MHQALLDENPQLLDKLEKAPKFDEALESELRAAITDFKNNYIKDNANVVAA